MAQLGRRITTPGMLVAAGLVAFAVILGGAVALGELLALGERPDGSTAVDSSITSWVVAHRISALTVIARALSTLGSQAVLAPATAVVFAVLLGRRRLVAAGLLVVVWGGAIGLYSLAKLLVDRMRPPADLWLTRVRPTASFPSGHATQSLATLLALALVSALWPGRARRVAMAVAVALAIGVGWSRVYLGVHWATDVGAGWLVAAAWLVISVGLAGAARRMLRARAGR